MCDPLAPWAWRETAPQDSDTKAAWCYAVSALARVLRDTGGLRRLQVDGKTSARQRAIGSILLPSGVVAPHP